MGASEWVAIGLAGLGVLFGIIGWLLARKDDAQEKEIVTMKKYFEAVFTKLDANANNLADFKTYVAGEHYKARTIDEKFDKIETTFKDGFREMGTKLDKVADAMMRHIEGEQTGKYRPFKGD